MAQIRDGKFAPLKIKVLWTAVFFGCFMIGRNIPIPLLHQAAAGTTQVNAEILDAANIATGGNFFSPSVFSLGLGPYMGAMILWRFLFIGRIARDRKIPDDVVERARQVLMGVLAVFQAVSLTATYTIGPLPWGPFAPQVNAKIVVVVILTAGALLVAWLATQNGELGLGGITIFILYQIIITAMRNIETLDIASHPEYVHVLLLVGLSCACVLVIGIFAGNAELRLHVNKISIDSGFSGLSYLPIKLNPAGASPIMYAVALLAIPQYVVRTAGAVIPGASHGANRFLAAWALSKPAGFTAYLILMFALTIFFGLFTVDPKETAKRMEDSGEYFDGVAPGNATRQYVRHRVIALCMLSGLFLAIFTGLPMLFIGPYPHLQYELMSPGTVMILLGLLWLLQEEIADTMIGTRYQFALRETSGKATA